MYYREIKKNNLKQMQANEKKTSKDSVPFAEQSNDTFADYAVFLECGGLLPPGLGKSDRDQAVSGGRTPSRAKIYGRVTDVLAGAG